MARPSRRDTAWAALLVGILLFLNGCSESAMKQPVQPAASFQTGNPVPGNALTGLKIAVQACPVFLEPKDTSPAFGPLIMGEVVTWLDSRDTWVRVWIPRLRISGWIPEENAGQALDTTHNPPSIPEGEFTTLVGVPEKFNVREGPSGKSGVVLIARKGDEFILVGEREGWYRVWLPKHSKTGSAVGGDFFNLS